jgi:hypothetical protein
MSDKIESMSARRKRSITGLLSTNVFQGQEMNEKIADISEKRAHR